MKFSIFGLFALCFSLGLSAQTKLLDITEESDSPGKFGRRAKHFIEPNFGYGAYFIQAEQGPEQNMWKSYDFHAGLRYRNLIAYRFAIGAEIAYHSENFRIDKDEPGLLNLAQPVGSEILKQRFNTQNIEGSVFLRLLNKENLAAKTRTVDVAYVFGYRFTNEFTTETELANETTYTQVIDNYEEIQRTYSAVELRLCLDKIGFTARYRLNPFLNGSDNAFDEFFWNNGDDLPPLSLGIQLNLF